MKCENLQFNLSVYVDDCLTIEEREILDEHLAQCPLCRQKLADFQALRNGLRQFARPVLPNDLLNAVRYAVTAELKPVQIISSPISSESFLEWMRSRLMPLGVGTFTSLFLGFTLLWVLLSGINMAPQNPQFASYEKNSQAPVYLANSNPKASVNEFELSASDFAAARIAVSGESPSVNPQGALIALTKSFIRGKMKDDEVVVVADVFGNGLAHIEEVVEPSENLEMVYELEKALQTGSEFAPFVPAKLDQRSESVRVVLKIKSVDINTRLKNKKK